MGFLFSLDHSSSDLRALGSIGARPRFSARSGRARDTFARASVQKAGRRVAHVHVEAWQDARTRPIAMLRGNFLMPGDG